VATSAILGVLARVAVIGLLSTSALEKLRSGEGFRTVLRTLGARRTTALWLAVCLAELAGSGLMVAALPRWLAGGAVLGIGTVFAAAGAYAIRIGANVACACFGQLGRQHRLGWRQIQALPLWGLLAIGVVIWQPSTTEQRISLVYAAIVGVLVIYGYLLARAVARARADRMALLAPRAVNPSTSGLVRFNVPPTEVRALVRPVKEVG
jgi:hypothetical protein